MNWKRLIPFIGKYLALAEHSTVPVDFLIAFDRLVREWEAQNPEVRPLHLGKLLNLYFPNMIRSEFNHPYLYSYTMRYMDIIIQAKQLLYPKSTQYIKVYLESRVPAGRDIEKDRITLQELADELHCSINQLPYKLPDAHQAVAADYFVKQWREYRLMVRLLQALSIRNLCTATISLAIMGFFIDGPFGFLLRQRPTRQIQASIEQYFASPESLQRIADLAEGQIQPPV